MPYTPADSGAMTAISNAQAVTLSLTLQENLGQVQVNGSISGGPVPYNTWVALYSTQPDPTNPNEGYLWWPGSYVNTSTFSYQSNQIAGTGYYGAIIYNDVVIATVGPTTA